jgi:hypothetical protein
LVNLGRDVVGHDAGNVGRKTRYFKTNPIKQAHSGVSLFDVRSVVGNKQQTADDCCFSGGVSLLVGFYPSCRNL